MIALLIFSPANQVTHNVPESGHEPCNEHTYGVDAMNAMNAPTVGVIGAGYWGQNLVRNLHELPALAAICDSDQERLQVMADRYATCPAEVLPIVKTRIGVD